MKKSSGVNMGQLLLFSIVAALGGLLFGFDIAIITGAGPFLTKTFELNSMQEGWAYSSLLFGCIFGAAIVGLIADSWGRKRILYIAALIFFISSLWLAFSGNLTELIIARIIGGIAVGAVSSVAPIFISEVSPAKYRGRLVSMYQLFIVTGIVISYLVNYLLYDIGANNWRWMFASGAIPSAFFFIMLMFVSETPRFLYMKGKKEEAHKVLERIGGKELATKQIEEIKKSLNGGKGSIKMLFSPSIRKVLLIGFGLAVLVQISGINTIIDYSPKIFATAGWKIDAGLFATFGLGLVNFICTWASILFIDRFGRRPMYIIGSTGMTLMLLGLAILGLFGHFSGIKVLFLIIGFIIFFASFVGPVFWTYISEIFPNWIRGIAMSVPVFTQWVFNAIIVLVFPSMLNNLNPGITFGMLAIFAFGQLIFAIKYMKETKGKTLEEIEKLWVAKK